MQFYRSDLSLYPLSFFHSRAELGRALAIVKVTLQVNGNSQILGVRPPKTTRAIKIKSATNNYVGEVNPHAKFGNMPITGGFSPDR